MEVSEGEWSSSSSCSIYKAARSIKKRDNSLYNALRSIYQDSVFVSEISQLWPQLPLLANLRCGLWYSSDFHSTCYFKSTDGHTNNFSFSTSRLNLHVAHHAAQKGGCMIVDSTRRGKRFPDSMSKTIPIWTCVLNRAIAHYRTDFHIHNASPQKSEDFVSNGCGEIAREDVSCDWDCSLHLPLWVPQTEKASIEEHLEEWTQQLKASGADIASLASSLKKPLRPLWISQKTVIWLNEVPHHDSWDFTPIILVSASSSSNGVSQHNRTTSEFSWNYIPGAGDDEESWSRGLSPPLFWNNVYDLINSGPEMCNQKVAEIVEKSRVCRAYRGENAPQIRVKSLSHEEPPLSSDITNVEIDTKASEGFDISWLGSTNLAVGASQFATNVADVDCILNCDRESISVSLPSAEAYLHLPMVSSKFDRFSLLNNLPKAVSFAKFNLNKGKRLLVCCNNGEDISVCVCLSILMSLFDEKGTFDDGKSFNTTNVTKWDMRRRLVFVCKFATNARPSRGNLRQVFNLLIGGKCNLQPQEEDDGTTVPRYGLLLRKVIRHVKCEAAAREPLCWFVAWKNFVANLPAVVVDVTKDDVCSICMKDFDEEGDGNKRVPCGHVYHSNCITLWLHRCNSCPLCRRHISLHQLDPI